MADDDSSQDSQMAGSRGTSAGSLGSAEDSEFEELVAEGREEHPIVRYTRLVRDKKAELEYVYNPEVEKNKTKDMRPLWEAAKKTVEGGISDLKALIEEKRSKVEDEQTILKLEVLERDLELISMRFDMHLQKLDGKPAQPHEPTPKSYEQRKLELQERQERCQKIEESLKQSTLAAVQYGKMDYCQRLEYAEQLKDEARGKIGAIHTGYLGTGLRRCDIEEVTGDKLQEVSLEARRKMDVFLCDPSKAGGQACQHCQRTADPTDLSLPCCLRPGSAAMTDQPVGFFVRYAVLSCVRSTEPKVREDAITNFRNLSKVDDSEGSSDIKKMVAMPVAEWDRLVRALYGKDPTEYGCVESSLQQLTSLLFSAVKCALKTSPSCMESIRDNTIKYYHESGLRITDVDLYQTLIGTGQMGIFGYLSWFTKFVLHAITEDIQTRRVLILAEMWKFNTNVCPALVVIYKYGQGKYPWMEALLYNFTSVFSHFWTSGASTPAPERRSLAEWEEPGPAPGLPGTLGLGRALVPRLLPEAACSQCTKRISRAARKLYPVPFQSCHGEEQFPREVACLARAPGILSRDVWSEDLTSSPRTVQVVCSTGCLLRALEGASPHIHRLLQLAPHPGTEPGPGAVWPQELDSIKYFSLRRLMERHYYSPEYDLRQRQDRDQQAELAEEPDSLAAARPPLPGAGDSLGAEVSEDMRQYHQNILLHDRTDPALKCSHHKLWSGKARFHPVNDLIKYAAKSSESGTSSCCLDLRLVVETCERLDLPLQDAGRRAALAAAIRSLNTRTIHLFNSSLAEVPVDFLREKCHKLVLAPTAGKEKDDLADVWREADKRYNATLNKIFDEVPCLLGIWAADFDECTVDGLLICRDPKTFYAFRPHDPKAFWTLLTEKISDNLYTYINGIVKSITDSVTASSMNDFPNWGEHDLAVNAVKALAVFRTEKIRLRLISRLTEAGGINRFGAVQSGKGRPEGIEMHETMLDEHWSPEALLAEEPSPGQVLRFASRHLVGCPHTLGWQGHLLSWRDTVSKDEDFFNTSAWMLECREVGKMAGRPFPKAPDSFWAMLPKKLLTLTMKIPKMVVDVDPDSVPNVVLELGSVPQNCLDDMRREDMVTFAFISENRTPKYVILFGVVNSKIVGLVINKQSTVDKIYVLTKEHCYENKLTVRASELFGEVGTQDDAGSWSFARKEDLKHSAHNMSAGYLDRSLGSVLWTGELQLCLLDLGPLAGMEKHTELCRLLQFSLKEAKLKTEKMDMGAVRNCAFMAPSGHTVCSVYACIVTEHALPDNKDLLDMFSNKTKAENPSLVAFNVERKIVEGVIGTFKKCFFFYVHMHDSYYIHSELQDTKSIMVGFFLSPREMTREVLQQPAPDLGRRLMLLRFDHRMGVLVAYIPKEKGKGQQLWEKLTEDSRSLTSCHIKHFKKLKRPPKTGLQQLDELKLADETASKVKTNRKDNPAKPAQPASNGARPKEVIGKKAESKVEDVKAAAGEDKAPADPSTICWKCHSTEETKKLSKCGGCRKARYCSVACQESDWSRHQGYCARVVERRKERKGETANDIITIE